MKIKINLEKLHPDLSMHRRFLLPERVSSYRVNVIKPDVKPFLPLFHQKLCQQSNFRLTSATWIESFTIRGVLGLTIFLLSLLRATNAASPSLTAENLGHSENLRFDNDIPAELQMGGTDHQLG
jgi:hypothetical protein